MYKKVTRLSLVAIMLLLGGAFFTASAQTGTCSGGASLSGWYRMLVSGGGKYLSGAVYFDGNCNVSGNNLTGGSGGQYVTTSVTGTYGQNSDGTFNITLNPAGQSTQTYLVGVSESGNKARGLESDNTIGAVIDLQSQLTTLTSGYTTASLNGSYAASCTGNSEADFNYLTFDAQGNLTGLDVYNNNGGQGSNPIQGTYSVNGDGTFSGSLTGSYSFTGVIDDGISEIEYTYYQPGTGGVLVCTGKQSTPVNLLGHYGFVVGGTARGGGGGKYLSGSIYFNGAGVLSGNVNGGIDSQYGNTSVTGSYSLNSNNTISVTMNLANPSGTQTYLVGVSGSGNEAIGIETDNTAFATIDMQNQLWPSNTPPYSNASLAGTYSASCAGSGVDLNWVTFDGKGGIQGVDGYYNGSYGDNPYTGSYTVNGDGTFSGSFVGPIYSVYTMTGVIDNWTAEIEYTYLLSGVGGVVSCPGESTYGPVGTNPVTATPTFSLAPGAYLSPQTVKLADTTSGAVIHYTTDGTAPTVKSPTYSQPVQLSATATIQAIAVASVHNNSAIAAGTYFLVQSQTITFPTIPTQTYPSAPLTLNATASSGLPVSYAILSGPASVNGNILTITGTGSVTVQASQAGNGLYAAAAPVAQTFTVEASTGTTVTTLVSSINPSKSGHAVTFTATVSSAGTPTGYVEFLDGATVLAKLVLKSSTINYSTAKLPVGSNSITAMYLGDANNSGSTSAPVNQLVVAATTTALAASPTQAAYGQPVMLTATVASSIGAPPDGETVSFNQGKNILGTGMLSGGMTNLSTSILGVGTKTVIAVYGGDTNFAGSQSKVASIVVRKATTTTSVISSQNPSNLGQAVTFTAIVMPQFTGVPTGTVTFSDGTKALKNVPLSGGAASFTTSNLASGSHTITATYNGSGSFLGSSESMPQTVLP